MNDSRPANLEMGLASRWKIFCLYVCLARPNMSAKWRSHAKHLHSWRSSRPSVWPLQTSQETSGVTIPANEHYLTQMEGGTVNKLAHSTSPGVMLEKLCKMAAVKRFICVVHLIYTSFKQVDVSKPSLLLFWRALKTREKKIGIRQINAGRNVRRGLRREHKAANKSCL